MIDLLVILLLSTCIVFGYILNRRIILVHKSKTEFAKMLKDFDQAITRAEISVQELTELTNESKIVLKELLNKAERLENQLSFSIDLGAEIANKLEENITKSEKLQIFSGKNSYVIPESFQPKKDNFNDLLSMATASKKTKDTEKI